MWLRGDARPGSPAAPRAPLARLGSRSPRRRAAGYAAALLGTAAATVAFVPVRDEVTDVSKGFAFLTVVVVSAALGRLGPGVLASVLGFLAFNFFLLPPYHTFVLARAEHIVVLFVFLGLSVLISALLARATERAEAAEAREAELRTLQTLSAELVSAVPGPETYEGILTRLLELFGFAAGSLWVHDPSTRGLEERVAVGAAPGELAPRRDAGASPTPEHLPLSVGGRVVGLLLLRRERPPLAPAESRVMRAFCDQFALVLERDRLLHAAAESEALRRTEEVRRSLLAAVSHDLRSPLSAIKASVTDLLSGADEVLTDRYREALDSIDMETDRLIDLVTNLLDMSRIEGGVLQPRLQAVDLAEVAATCADRLRRQWPQLDVQVRIAEDAALVRADPVFLERVLANLLDNAARSASEGSGSSIRVEARVSDGEVGVRVIDRGRGVPLGEREKLFYPFFRMSRRHPREGAGLGLPIAKGFLDVMGGRIWIEDTPGGGATFAFSLPAAIPAATP